MIEISAIERRWFDERIARLDLGAHSAGVADETSTIVGSEAECPIGFAPGRFMDEHAFLLTLQAVCTDCIGIPAIEYGSRQAHGENRG